MLCAKLFPELDVPWLTKAPQGNVKDCALKKKAESKQHVVQSVREVQREPDEEHRTTSRPEVTKLFQF